MFSRLVVVFSGYLGFQFSVASFFKDRDLVSGRESMRCCCFLPALGRCITAGRHGAAEACSTPGVAESEGSDPGCCVDECGKGDTKRSLDFNVRSDSLRLESKHNSMQIFLLQPRSFEMAVGSHSE